MEWGTLLGEIIEGSGDLCKAFDEPLVEVEESDKGLALLQVPWDWPLNNSSNLCWVHRDAIMRDDQTEVLHLISLKLALLRLEVELVSTQSL